MLHVYCDGSCINNGLPNALASWSFLVTDEEGNIVEACTGRVTGAQNSNRAELVAFLKCLGYVLNNRKSHFIIHVDYEAIYLFCNGKSTPKSNYGLYREIAKRLELCQDRITVKKVKAHSAGETVMELFNDTVDILARKTCTLLRQLAG